MKPTFFGLMRVIICFLSHPLSPFLALQYSSNISNTVHFEFHI